MTKDIESSFQESSTEILPHEKEQDVEVKKSFGIYFEEASNMPNATDEFITKTIEDAVKQSPHSAKINFPYVSEHPINEYSGERLFCKAFPWLFPGGYGDFITCLFF